MRVSVIFLIFCAFLAFESSAIDYCKVSHDVAVQWENLNNISYSMNCCEVSEKQWQFIAWYFWRVGSHLNVTEISREIEFHKLSLYMDFFVRDLYRYTALEYYTHRILYNVQDELADKQDDVFDHHTYEWHPELSKHGNRTYYIEEDKMNIRSHILKRNWQREDEPDSGSVVLASNIEIIDHYLSGKKAKHPFTSKRSHYVILIYKEIHHEWDRIASSILAKLWKVHGILNAIVISSCQKKDVSSSNSIEKHSKLIWFDFRLESLINLQTHAN